MFCDRYYFHYFESHWKSRGFEKTTMKQSASLFLSPKRIHLFFVSTKPPYRQSGFCPRYRSACLCHRLLLAPCFGPNWRQSTQAETFLSLSIRYEASSCLVFFESTHLLYRACSLKSRCSGAERTHIHITLTYIHFLLPTLTLTATCINPSPP